MHDQSVSGLIVPRISACSGKAGRDAERSAVAHRALGHLAKVEDEVARRERIAARGRGTGSVALAALRARIQVEQVLGRKRVDGRVADLLGLGVRRQRQERVAGAVVLGGDAGGPREHVHSLRERDRGDPEEGEDAMHPPRHRSRGVGGAVVEPDRDERLPDEPAERRPHLEARVVRSDPEGLEQEAGEREEEEAPEEDPVAEPVALRLVGEGRSGLDGAPVGEAKRPEHAALDGEDAQADDQREAEDVQEERVSEVEPALPEEPAEDGLGKVVLEGQDPRPDEEDDEAVEDEQVPEPRQRVATADPRVRGDDLRRPDGTLHHVSDRRSGAPATVLQDESPDADEEDRHRDGDEDVPEDDLPGLEAREGLARLLGAQEDGHQYSFSSSSATSKRSATAP